jgi:transcriptional regulator with XRE-family HTH domain
MAKTLRAWRTERLLSTRRLAELAGASNKTIVQLENGRQTASFVTIEKISRVLGVEPRDVIEFSRAIDARAGTIAPVGPAGDAVGPPAHVVCVGGAGTLLTLTRRLLETELERNRNRYGVTTIIGVPVTVEQLACLQPDMLIIDVDADARFALELVRGLPGYAGTRDVPTILTGHDRQLLEAGAAETARDGAPAVTIAPLDRDQRALVAAVESLISQVAVASPDSDG